MRAKRCWSNPPTGSARSGVPNARFWRVGVEDIKGRTPWLVRPRERRISPINRLERQLASKLDQAGIQNGQRPQPGGAIGVVDGQNGTVVQHVVDVEVCPH